MKKLVLFFSAIPLSVLIFFGCRKNTNEQVLSPDEKVTHQQTVTTVPVSDFNRGPGVCNPDAYIITLESKTLVNGNWEWIWSVQNSNPGNGNNGTVQNLSHWGMQFGACFAWTSVTSAAFSSDGAIWTTFTPLFQTDPSQSCMTDPVLKFDFGTTGAVKSYYKLVLNKDYPPGWVPGYYKSGANTGCCIFNFNGIGCQGSGTEE